MAEETRGRTDFRGWLTVTIDPETARDHDDAVGIERRPDGGYRLAVHIADVAHYVREGGALDQEAYLRGTSVYFPDRVVPMLPHALSSDVCSLVEGQDRLTQTVVIDLDARGKVEKTAFHDGVIRSAARLSYQQAQAIVDGDREARERFAALVPSLLAMDELAKLMRGLRYERGSLDFDLPEPKLVLDAQGEMTGIVRHERLGSMRLIEEFMLAANEAVAEQLHRAGAGALYRIHEQPEPGRVEEFVDLVASLGYRVPGKLDEIRPEHFQLILRQIEGKPEEKLVSYLLLRTMRLARYHEENLGHFGLAAEMYAHFTSPIRRYPDLVVHRALRALRGGKDAEREAWLKGKLPEMGLHLSEMERRASEAERELIEWKKVRFMAGKVGETFTGYVTGVQAFGLFVELEEVYVQGLVHVSSMTDDYYRFDEKAHLLSGESAGKVYRLGDRASVQVARVDLDRRQIDFALVDVLERARAGGAQHRPPGRRAAPGAGEAGRPPAGKPGGPPAGPTRGAGARQRGPGPGGDAGRTDSWRRAPPRLEWPLWPTACLEKTGVDREHWSLETPRPQLRSPHGGAQPVCEGADLPAEGDPPGVPLHHRGRAGGAAAAARQARGVRLRPGAGPGGPQPDPGRAALPDQGRPRELLLHRPRGEGGAARPRRQAAQDRGVGLRGHHPRGLTRPCAPSSSGRPATSTTGRAPSCARSPAPTPTA